MFDSLKEFANLSGICLVSFDPTTKKFVEVNDNFVDYIGYSREQLLSQVYTTFMYQEDIESSEEFVKNRTIKFSKLANYVNRYINGKTGEVLTLMWVSDSLAYKKESKYNTSFVIDVTNLMDEYYRKLIKSEAVLDLYNIIKGN